MDKQTKHVSATFTASLDLQPHLDYKLDLAVLVLVLHVELILLSEGGHHRTIRPLISQNLQLFCTFELVTSLHSALHTLHVILSVF